VCVCVYIYSISPRIISRLLTVSVLWKNTQCTVCHRTRQGQGCAEASSLFCEGLYKQLRGLHNNVNVDARNLSRLTYCATDCVLYCSFLRRLTGEVGWVWADWIAYLKSKITREITATRIDSSGPLHVEKSSLNVLKLHLYKFSSLRGKSTLTSTALCNTNLTETEFGLLF
jgi:hypothetical protein